jgi:hypothetical protein
MPGETIMKDDQVIATQATDLLRTLIGNACVNTGEPASGNEARSVDALEDFFAGSGPSCTTATTSGWMSRARACRR